MFHGENTNQEQMTELTRSETAQLQGGIALLVPAVQKASAAAASSTATDDVWIEGRIITAENFDSAYS